MKNNKFILLFIVFIINFYFLLLFITLSPAQDIDINIETGVGSPGSRNNQVVINLQNPHDSLRGLQLDICDKDNYLASRSCEAVGRAAAFDCSTHEKKRGCASVLIYAVGAFLEPGQGPVISISYDVSPNAPAGDCRRLTLKNAVASDENKKPLKAVTENGLFCFTEDDAAQTSTTTTPASTTTIPAASTAQPAGNADTPGMTTTISVAPDNINVNIKTTTIPKTPTRVIPGFVVKTTPAALISPGSTPPSTITEAASGPIGSPEGPSEKSPATTTVMLSATTTPVSLYRVFITPSAGMVDSGGLLLFSAETLSDGSPVAAKNRWQIVPPSTIGSRIDGKGLFSAGINTTGYHVQETVRVTDALNADSFAGASVIVKVKEPLPQGCRLKINPSSATVRPGQSIRFFAKSCGDKCVPGSYKWGINSNIGSSVSSEGVFTAENNDSSQSAIDIITVEDSANRISTNAIVTVLSRRQSGSPPVTDRKSRPEDLSGQGGYFKALMMIALPLLFFFLIGIVLYRRIKR